MARVKREFPGDVVRADLLAAGEIFIDPKVLSDFAPEDSFRLLHAITREVFAFRHDTGADDVIVEWDVPEPALFGHKRHRGGALIDAWIAPGALIVGPDGDLVQLRIAHAPVVPHCGERFPTGAIQRHRRA